MTPQEKMIKLLHSYNPDLPMSPGMKAQFLWLRELIIAQELAERGEQPVEPEDKPLADIIKEQFPLYDRRSLCKKDHCCESVLLDERERLHVVINRGTGEAKASASPDANVEKNRQLLLERSIVGLQKYGVTTERTDLTRAEWVQHAIEETLDLANYLQALKTNIESEEHRIRKSFLEGFQMRGEADSASPNGCVWRSPEEAWVNSDAEEEFRVVMRKQEGS